MKKPGLPCVAIRVGTQLLTGALETRLAPVTCDAILKILPLRARLIQSRWSGEAAWVPLGDLDLNVPAENQLHRPRPGQVLFHPAAESETEILLPYGVTAFAAVCGAISGNHFLTIDGQGGRLLEIGRQVLWQGAQEIEFVVMS